MISAKTTKTSLSPIFQPTPAMDYLHCHVALPLSAVNNITREQPRFFRQHKIQAVIQLGVI